MFYHLQTSIRGHAIVPLVLLWLVHLSLVTSEPLQELEEARAKWEDVSTSGSSNDYLFQYVVHQKGMDNDPRIVRVQDGQLQSVDRLMLVFGCPPEDLDKYSTIHGLFNRLQEAIKDKNNMSVTVTYHERMGYPMEMSVRSPLSSDDEDWSAEIDYLTHLPYETSQLEYHQGLWESLGVSSYEYTSMFACSSCEEAIPKRIQVQDYEIVSVTNANTGIANTGTIQTPEEAFGYIQNAIASDYQHVDVKYDPTYGYITYYSIQFFLGMFDGDEYGQLMDFVANEIENPGFLDGGENDGGDGGELIENTDASDELVILPISEKPTQWEPGEWADEEGSNTVAIPDDSVPLEEPGEFEGAGSDEVSNGEDGNNDVSDSASQESRGNDQSIQDELDKDVAESNEEGILLEPESSKGMLSLEEESTAARKQLWLSLVGCLSFGWAVLV